MLGKFKLLSLNKFLDNMIVTAEYDTTNQHGYMVDVFLFLSDLEEPLNKYSVMVYLTAIP